MAFSEQVAAEILEGLAQCKSLNAVCREPGMPSPSTVLRWCDEHPEFEEQYTRVRARSYRLLADEILEISDEESVMVRHPKAGDDENADTEVVFDSTAVARNRLRVDSRKWMLSKMLPKIYGDKLQTEVTGANGGPVQVATVTIELVKPKAE